MTWGFLLNAETELDLLVMRGGRGQGKSSMAEQVGHLWKERKEEGGLAGGSSEGGSGLSRSGATQQEVPARAGPEWPGPRELGCGPAAPPRRPPWLSRAVSSFWLLGDGAPLHLPAQAVLWTSALCSPGQCLGVGLPGPRIGM